MSIPADLPNVDVQVRYLAGAYCTGTVQGMRTSSTSSPVAAALKLAQKLWGRCGVAKDVTPSGSPTATYTCRIAPSAGALS